MSLSSVPTWMLAEAANDVSEAYTEDIDQELDLRKPDEAKVYFGDCAGKAIFVPLEPEQDENGPIIELNCWYDENDNEIWI